MVRDGFGELDHIVASDEDNESLEHSNHEKLNPFRRRNHPI